MSVSVSVFSPSLKKQAQRFLRAKGEFGMESLILEGPKRDRGNTRTFFGASKACSSSSSWKH